MSTAQLPERVKDAPAAKARPAAPPAPAPAQPAQTDPPSDAWFGDRVALTLWMFAALIIALLLMKDLFYAVVLGHA
jgi:hypothetical protein